MMSVTVFSASIMWMPWGWNKPENTEGAMSSPFMR